MGGVIHAFSGKNMSYEKHIVGFNVYVMSLLICLKWCYKLI